MRSVFSWLTRASLRFRAVTIGMMFVVFITGTSAITQLRQELIPAVEFPQTIILAQASGMTSEQVLTLLTTRIEAALSEIPEIVNLESTTTGAFGAVITARNDFGLNQSRLRAEIQRALDSIWLPLRAIQPGADEAPEVFSRRLLADLPAEVLIYLAGRDANFLFQLSPDIWAALSPETVRETMAYLAAQQQETAAEATALRRLIDQEIVPALEALEVVGTVSVDGGQTLPGDNNGEVQRPTTTLTRSQLLQLSPEAWRVIAPAIGMAEMPLSAETAALLAAQPFTVPQTAPALPASWQIDRFKDATDLLEMRTLTRNLGAVFNNFLETGRIVGALGQTDDLTPEVIERMLAIDASLVQYFKAEHLAAMSDEVFASLPDAFIAGLDGFTRDELAARALAESVTGIDASPPPVNLPSAWRIQPPQLITFSFDDLPLATFSISGTSAEIIDTSMPLADTSDTDASGVVDATSRTEQPEAIAAIPEGPPLPFIFNLIGAQFGIELNTADDLIDIRLPDDVASQFGASTLRAADLFNFIVLLNDPDALPPGVEAPTLPINPAVLIGGLSPEAVAFLAEYDPSFLPNLSAAVFNSFSDAVLAQEQIAPPLDPVWNTLASQPQFADRPLRNGRDVIQLGGGQASQVLNTINSTVPERFSGYEVRLFDSISPALARYFSLHEPNFFTNLDADLLLKFSPAVLSALPADVYNQVDSTVASQLRAIGSGEQPSAAAELAARYTLDIPPADPDAPPLNPDWRFIGDFIGVELNTADDFFRFFDDVTAFLNSFFDSAQGTAFAPNLFGGLSGEALDYMVAREPALLVGLRIEALQLLSPEVFASLPQEIQERLNNGGTPFVPTAAVTRTNGNASLLVTIFKARDANTIEAYYAAQEVLRRINEENPLIAIDVAFEQASFIEESISGVAREGSLGGVFAIVVILTFLSSGVWALRPRRIVAGLMVGLLLAMLALVVFVNANAYGGDLARGFENTDVVLRVLLIVGILGGLFTLLWPGRLPRPAWRSTIVVAVSIPLSILTAFTLMRWLPPTVNAALSPFAEGSPILTFLLRLFPANLTINIMTLSGLTVAIGRVVDDSIVVLENIFREVQAGVDQREAILKGTRDVCVAIFAATMITVIVFLPLGLTGGIIGEFFLPFGLAVSYSLIASFFVAITVVPVLAYLFLDKREISGEGVTSLERLYLPALKWALAKPLHRAVVIGLAFASLVLSAVLFSTRPQAFLPAFGEPQVSVSVNLPTGTSIIETNALVEQFEAYVASQAPEGSVRRILTTIGNSGVSFQTLLLGTSTVNENVASISISVENPADLDALTLQFREAAETIFGAGNVTVSAASLSEQGFGGFSLVLAGPQEELEAINDRVIAVLNSVPGLANASSNLSDFAAGGGDGPARYIRIDGESAVRFRAELETDNTLGVTAQAKEAVLALPELPASIRVSEGFETQLQTEGFANLFVAMGIAIAIVIVVLIITFGSAVHWMAIMLSVIVAPVGSAVLLTLTNRVLGISALIGLLMLIGLVVTNAVVLIDRVQANRRERGMSVYDALIEGGSRRLRPILMTALATIMALLPLAIGLSRGAIIASELGTVVIGGLVSSTLLTLIVVPVAYYILAPLHERFAILFGGRRREIPVSTSKPVEVAK
ncbi:MAG: efflux RND transporter permease subunit [Aggregatilineales bacterium]